MLVKQLEVEQGKCVRTELTVSKVRRHVLSLVDLHRSFLQTKSTTGTGDVYPPKSEALLAVCEAFIDEEEATKVADGKKKEEVQEKQREKRRQEEELVASSVAASKRPKVRRSSGAADVLGDTIKSTMSMFLEFKQQQQSSAQVQMMEQMFSFMREQMREQHEQTKQLLKQVMKEKGPEEQDN